jgi:tricorn protease
MWGDKKLRLRYIDIDSGDITDIAKSGYNEIRDFTWSPDSQWIVYSDSDDNRMSRLYLYGLKDKSKTALTSKWYDSSNPTFSDCGEILFFTSSRDFNPIYSQTEWNHAYRDMSRVYYLTMSADTPDPLAPKNDEVEIKDKADKDDKDEEKEEKEEKEENKTVKVDRDGIQDRLGVLPVKPASYWNLTFADGKLYFNQYRLKHSPELKYFDLNKKEVKELGTGMGYEISDDNKKMLISKSGKYYVVDLPSSEPKLDKPIDMSDMKIWVDLHEEWKQIYNEAWRQMRDFFYDPGMHGVDWEAMHDKYAVLLPYVNHRNDLTYLIGELIGELNVGHAYVGGGDRETPDKIYTGLLGAEFEKDNSGYFKITKLLEGKNWHDEYTAPLTGIGKNINQGDYIISINGKSTKETDNIYSLMLGDGGKKIFVQVNDKPKADGTRELIIETSKDEAKLYYYEWVQENIRKVNEATDGRVGYIHIPNMVTEGLNEFVKHFYPQLTKDGLIIDDRGNGGGNVSPMIIERLRRELAMMGMGRNVPNPGTRPRGMHVGPKVLLVNQYSASDGDLFPYQFRKHELGTIIGVRTWGGVVGIRGSLPFVDGGTMLKPEFAHFAADGSDWIIEGHGVEPDIEVWNDPWKEFNGTDQQLNKAIEVIKKQLEENPPQIPDIPEFPDKSGKDN